MALSGNRDDRELAKFVADSNGDTAVRIYDSASILRGATWDYTAQARASLTDTWTFKEGGSGGTTTAVIVITYTDASKETILTVERTT